ncbi:hypothetical protein H4R18_005122 [Coemansia javaensis]|uniref:F-box domain-containing protein n=1 Tax=Coemansia javaensis TaxID=2761396 RepID=A0A9W8H8S6_9FUNG|nr:hypothetical protein H4R18_005122 [Coemansia javaensis]
MNSRDLPDDLIYLLVKGCFVDRKGAADTVKANLYLLAVCQRWRRVALPIVYSTVAIQYGSDPEDAKEDNKVATQRGSDPGDAKVATNLGLVASAGCAQAVGRIEIRVFHAVDPFPGLAEVIRLMRTAAEEWSGARTLAISMNPDTRVFDKFKVNVGEYEDEIGRTSAGLAATMPGVRHVVFDEYETNLIARELYGQLAAFYSGQLRSILSQHPITVHPDCTFRQLEHLQIRRQCRIGYQHPRVDPRTLVSLCLLGWPPTHSWAPFSADCGSDTIEFPSLKRLEITYLDPLQVLSVAVISAIDRILETAQGSSEVVLELDSMPLRGAHEFMARTLVTELLIHSEVTLDFMLGLILGFPSLTALTLSELRPEAISEDISVPGPGEASLVQPLSTKLKRIHISTWESDGIKDKLVAMAKYLLLKIPTLTEYHSKETPEWDILEFVDAYSDRYPHLDSVKFSLCRNYL